MFPTMLLNALIILIIAGVILWAITKIPMDAVIAQVIRVVVIVIVIIWLLYFLVGLMGSGPGPVFFHGFRS